MGTENNSRVWVKSDFLRLPAGWRKFLDRGSEFWIGPNGQKYYEDPRDGPIPAPWVMHLGATGEAFFHNIMEDRVTWTDPRFGEPSLTVAELSSRHGYTREWRSFVSHLQSQPDNHPVCLLWARLVNSQPRDSSIRYLQQAFSPPRQPQGHQQVSRHQALLLFPDPMHEHSSSRHGRLKLLGHADIDCRVAPRLLETERHNMRRIAAPVSLFQVQATETILHHVHLRMRNHPRHHRLAQMRRPFAPRYSVS